MGLLTERLALEPWSEEDADALLALAREPQVRRFLFDDRVVDREWVDDACRASTARFTSGSIGLFVVRVLDQPGVLAGFTGFLPVYDPPVLELVYALAPYFHGRGLATEMARAMIALAFTRHGFDVVRASTDEPNFASIRVLERLGMAAAGCTPGPRWPQLQFELPRARWSERRHDLARE